ncbi:hypothetical protein E3P78_00877 [Wallemia ichthyophaga]|nr:hypothetical protein E3P78_00877 [Wallemia ichthyophaga]
MIRISTGLNDKNKNEFKLLELDNELVEALEKQQVLEFKGDGDEDAVLCSNSNTYLLKNRMHSNSLTLLERDTHDTHDTHIVNTFHEILETHKCIPNMDKLDQILSHRVLLDPTESNTDKDRDVDSSLRYDYKRLSSSIQASDEEMRHALTARKIVHYNGEYRPVDAECLMRTLDLIANTLELLGMSMTNLDKQRVVEKVHEEHNVDKQYTDTVMDWFMSTPTSLDINAFVKEMGVCILKTHKHPTPFETFIDDWKGRVGYELSSYCSLDLLKGSYLIEAGRVKFFTSSSLSKSPSTRFQELFKMRGKWFAADLIPFIQDLGDSKELERLVLKFCRSQTDKSSGMETYTSRQRI